MIRATGWLAGSGRDSRPIFSTAQAAKDDELLGKLVEAGIVSATANGFVFAQPVSLDYYLAQQDDLWPMSVLEACDLLLAVGLADFDLLSNCWPHLLRLLPVTRN